MAEEIGSKPIDVQTLENIDSFDDLPDVTELTEAQLYAIRSGDLSSDYIAPFEWDGESYEQWRSIIDGINIEIPDSEADQKLIHRWVLDDVNDTVEDSEGDADGTNKGVTSVDGDFAGGSAGDGDGVDDHILTTTLGDFGSQMDSSYAFAFSFETADNGDFVSVIDSDSQERNGFQLTTRDFFGGTANKLGYGYRDDSDYRIRVDSNQDVTDGTTYRAVVNVPDPTDANSVEIWLNQSEENVNIADDSGSLTDPKNFNENVPLFADNSRGEIENHIDSVIDDFCVFDESLTQSEIESYQNPWE